MAQIPRWATHPSRSVQRRYLELLTVLRSNSKNGLPGLPVKVIFELSPEEHATLVAALKKVADEMSTSLDGTRPEPKAALFL